MATIGNVVISVFASTKGLSKSLAKAQKSIGAFAKKAAKTLKKLSVVIGVGVAAGITAVVATVNKYADEIDKLAKTSRKIGITTAELQKLQYQAELTGVSTQTLNMAMQRMVRRTSEAAQGTGEAKNALKELGLEAQSLSKLSADEQFYEIAKAMRAVGNQGDKVRLAMKIFDTEGVALVNTMNSNLALTAEEFDALGISVTQSGARMVEAYQDSKQKMSAIFSGFGLKLTEQLAEPFTKLIDWISQTIIEMGGMEAVANKVALAMVKSFREVVGVIAKIAGLTDKVKIGIASEQLKGAQSRLKTKQSLGLDTTANVKEIQKYTQKLSELNKGDNSLNSIDALITKLEKNISKQGEFVGGVEVGKRVGNLASSSTKAADSMKALTEATNAVTKNVVNKSGGYQTALGFVSDQPLDGRVGSIQEYINSMPAGKALQDMRQRGVFGGTNAQTTPNTKITLNMVTDAGEVTGELMASQMFIDGINRLQNDKMSKTARMAAV